MENKYFENEPKGFCKVCENFQELNAEYLCESCNQHQIGFEVWFRNYHQISIDAQVSEVTHGK